MNKIMDANWADGDGAALFIDTSNTSEGFARVKVKFFDGEIAIRVPVENLLRVLRQACGNSIVTSDGYEVSSSGEYVRFERKGDGGLRAVNLRAEDWFDRYGWTQVACETPTKVLDEDESGWQPGAPNELGKMYGIRCKKNGKLFVFAATLYHKLNGILEFGIDVDVPHPYVFRAWVYQIESHFLIPSPPAPKPIPEQPTAIARVNQLLAKLNMGASTDKTTLLVEREAITNELEAIAADLARQNERATT